VQPDVGYELLQFVPFRGSVSDVEDRVGIGGRWLTSKEAAALLRVHPKHIYRLLRKGLPAQRVGGQWRFRATEIEDWARGEPRKQARSEGNINPQIATKRDADAALLLSRDDVAVHALVAEVNRRAPPTIGLVAHDDARSTHWLEDPRVLATVLLGDIDAPSSVQLAWLHIAHEQFGLIGASGPPPDIAFMLRRRERVASWPSGSDLRTIVDSVLSREGFDTRVAHRSALLCSSHADVVSAVVRGDAQVGVTTAAWAIRFGLPFRPLGSRPLGLVAPASALGHPAVVRCWEVLQSIAFRSAIERAGGYDASDAGMIRYLRAEPSASTLALPPLERQNTRNSTVEPTAPAVVTDQGQTRWAIVVRDRGQDVSSQLLHAVTRLRKEGIRVGGFIQVPKRIRSRVAGYDLKRVIGNKRLSLARREASIGAGPVLAYRSFQFREDSFAKAREWLERDAVDADVLVLDGVSTRESQGGGHFEALAWASRLPAPVFVLACVRRDRIAAIVDKLGLAGRLVAVLEAPTDAASADAFGVSLVAVARG
jgi:putative molybdopterin biosynthesis protein